MSSDSYQIDVLYFLNPHLIWVEVIDSAIHKDDSYIFEQIGLYGVLPLEPVLNVEEENLQTKILDEWIPAASATIKKALSEAQEIWFSPTYIDRRSSIFDDNIHKYGEILIKKSNGKSHQLSKILIKSGLAVYDMGLFHQELCNGKLKTKLQNIEAQEVLRNIENYYKKRKDPKKNWLKLVKTNTVVSRTSSELEMTLTELNLKKHNKKFMNECFENKIKDFDLCKGVDEESAGRACKVKHNSNLKNTLKGIENISDDQDIKSTILKKKLQLMGTKNNNNSKFINCEAKEMLEETKEFFEINSYCKNKDSTGKTNDALQKNAYSRSLSSESNNTPSDVVRKTNITETKPGRKNKIANKIGSHEKTIAYGPPGISPQVLLYKKITQNEFDIERNKTNVAYEKNYMHLNHHLSDGDSNADFNASLEMSNKEYFLNTHQIINEPETNSKVTAFSDTCSVESKKSMHDSSKDVTVSLSKSKILKRKLILHKGKNEKTLNSSFTTSSDTTNKDSSSSVDEVPVKHKEKKVKSVSDSDNDDIEEVLKKINEEYPVNDFLNKLQVQEVKNKIDVHNSVLKNFVNPFKNVDRNISSFTDKVVTPVLMVHTKMNKRIEPVYKINDVHFNTHIQIVLKNMSIVRPMMLQTISWFCTLRGYSMFMISPLGSGKTMGYLPAVCRLVSDSCTENVNVGPACIILCATAKAVADVERMAKMFLGAKGKVLSCYAGVDETYVTTSLLNGCDLLISTPSFLVRLLQVTDFGVDMRCLATVVMDDCERLSEVYSNELKYILFRIKDSIKNRTNKELKVQYVLASRIWCDFMEPIAKTAPYSVVCIGAFQECVLYSKANMSVNFVQGDYKVNSVLEFLNEIDISKKTVIVCTTDDEVTAVRKALLKYKNQLFPCDSSMSIQDLYSVRTTWDDYQDPIMGPILLCCDDTLTHLNITDAHSLLNYSLPKLFSAFCKRFSVLNDEYPSIFAENCNNVKIKILIDQRNTEQLPKIINFIRRLTENIPEHLNNICDKVSVEKDKVKAAKLVPICDNLLSIGYCADYWNCISRHSVFQEYDESKEWVPKTGEIAFKILHYHSATLFSVRLHSNTVNGVERKYPQTYSTLSLKMGMFYSKESNRTPHGIPKVGDICAVSIKLNFFVRCRVIKVLSYYPRGNPNNVLVKLIDEETLENTRDIYLFYLPEELTKIETHVIQVRLANVQPKDKDVTFSNLARDQLKNITDKDDEIFVRGQAIMAVGNCVFVETLEACQDLSSLNKIVVKHDLKRELLEKHAILNTEHMHNIRKLCDGIFDNIDDIPSDCSLEFSKQSTKSQPIGTWAYLDKDDMSLVLFGSAISPHKFFVRLEKFESCLSTLIKDIQKYVAQNLEPVNDVNVNDIVLAMFPDGTFERARIDAVIYENKVRCFFLDQGDSSDVSYQNMYPIKEEFITRMPFQAIECRLLGVNPAGDEWTDFSTNWFCDKCYEDDTDSTKRLYVKYYCKEKAECTGGHKYGIVMIDTNGDEDVVINQLLIDFKLAQENLSEMIYLNELRIENNNGKEPKIVSSNDNVIDNTEVFAKCSKPQVIEPTSLQTFFQKPIRSVPLVDSDYEDAEGDERWHINMTDDLLKMFKPTTNSDAQTSNLQDENIAKTKLDSNADNLKLIFPKMLLPSKSKLGEIDSDDYTSPECSDSIVFSEKQTDTISVAQPRRPRLIWRQNQNMVSIKIDLIGVQNYDLTIKGRSLNFAAALRGVDYAFDLDLYGAVDVNSSSHCNKGQYILVRLGKILKKNWLTLSKDGGIRKWIVYDVDSIDVSSDDETADVEKNNSMLNVIQNIYNHDETESEDDEFLDDLNYRNTSDKVLYHK